MLLAGLGVRELWTAEDRWAEVTRAMLLTGDFLHPSINGHPYFDKPLLGYWVIIAAAQLLGGLNEWAIRLPSAIAGLLALWATISLGRKLWSEETARIAGWMLLTCHGFLFWGRTGQADMGNLAAIMLAINWYWGRRDKPGFFNAAVFYIICFLGAQLKGLAAVAVPFVAVAPDLLSGKRWRFLFTARHAAALLAGLACYLAPFIIESATRGGYSSSGLALVFRENIQRYFNPFDHKGAFYIYLYDLPLLLLPWAAIFILALPACLPRLKRLDAPSRWLILAATLAFLFFTASGSRRSYYILPLLPFCALLSARWLTDPAPSALKTAALRLTAALFLILAAAELASPLAWALVKTRAGVSLPPDLLPASFLLGALALGAWGLRRVRPTALARLMGVPAPIAAPLLMAAILLGGFFCRQQLSLEAFRTVKSFALSARMLRPQSEQVAFYNYNAAAVAFYMNHPKPIAVITNPAEAAQFLAGAPGQNILIAKQRELDKLNAALPQRLQMEALLTEAVPAGKKPDGKELAAVTLAGGAHRP